MYRGMVAAALSTRFLWCNLEWRQYIAWHRNVSMPRSYHSEYTRSRPISEVKQGWAGLVLR